MVYNDYDIVISGGIEIRGVKANVIQRRKQMDVPILEEYKFVANRDRAQISIEEMVILSTHLALECHSINNPKILELLHQNGKVSAEEIFIPILVKMLNNIAMIRPSLILAADPKQREVLSLSEDNVSVIEPNKLPEDGSVFMVAGHDVITNKRMDILEQFLLAISNHGFILLRESDVNEDIFSALQMYNLNIVLEKSCKDKILLLLRKAVEKPPQKMEVVYVRNDEFGWVEEVKEVMKKDKHTNKSIRLILVAEGDLENGVQGLVKCLVQEPNGEIVRTVIIQDENAPKFSLEDPFYSKQLDIDIVYNVLRPGKIWGTYRHLPYPEPKPTLIPHAYADLKVCSNIHCLKKNILLLKNIPSFFLFFKLSNAFQIGKRRSEFPPVDRGLDSTKQEERGQGGIRFFELQRCDVGHWKIDAGSDNEIQNGQLFYWFRILRDRCKWATSDGIRGEQVRKKYETI